MLLYYHGSDTFRLRQAVTLLATRTRERSVGGITTTSLDFTSDGSLPELERLLKYPSFFGEVSVLVGHHAYANADTAAAVQDILERYVVPTLTDVVVCLCQAEPAGRESAASKRLTSYLQKHATETTEYNPLTGAARAQWVREQCHQQKCTIEPAAVSELIGRTREDTWALASEISKLCSFAHESGAIDVQAVRQLVPAAHEHDEWELSNALAEKDKRGAITALFRRLAGGSPEQLLLGSLAASIRTLLTVKDLSERGIPAGSIAKSAGLHPYVVTKTLRGISGYSTPQLRQALERLAWLDRAFKDGRADATDGLFQVLLTL